MRIPKLAKILNQECKIRVADRKDRLAYNDTPVALGEVYGQGVEVAMSLKRSCDSGRHRNGRYQSVQKHFVIV